MTDLPEPMSRQDILLHNIAVGTPNIEDMIPMSRQEVYLKYISENIAIDDTSLLPRLIALEKRVTALENTIGTLNEQLEGVLNGNG